MFFSLLQESEWTAGVTPGVPPPLSGRGERPEPRGAQGWVEGQGAETSGRHKNPERKTASAGENKQRLWFNITLIELNRNDSKSTSNIFFFFFIYCSCQSAGNCFCRELIFQKHKHPIEENVSVLFFSKLHFFFLI